MRRSLLRPRPWGQALLSRSQQTKRTFSTPPIQNPNPPDPIEPSNEQAMPLGRYYEIIIKDPRFNPKDKPEAPPAPAKPESDEPRAPRGRKPKDSNNDGKSKSAAAAAAAAEPTASTPNQPIPTPSPSTASPQAQARVIFGSRLVGPAERAERLASLRQQSRLIAGVLVPPRPEEPDNCCMSGCVNCVWDRYRDEMEIWAAANSEVDRRLRTQDVGVAATADSAAMAPSIGTSGQRIELRTASIGDDGSGRVENWDAGGQGAGGTLTKDFWDEELYRNVPVGIREFMKQEKRLKEKHMKEGTVGG